MKPHKTRVIYSDDYYRAKKLVSDPLFKERIAWLYAEYKKHGVPVPAKGFKTYEEYMAWMDRFWKRWASIEYSQEMKDLIHSASREVPHTNEDYDRVVRMRDEMLPPVPGQFRDDLLREFGINPRNKKFASFLERYIFFGKKELQESRFHISWKRNEKTNKFELYLQIFPYTKREDVMDFWDEVVKAQKMSNDFVGKNKPWMTFDRDLEIFRTWQNVTSGAHRRHGKKPWFEGGQKPSDHDVYGILHKKYPKLTLGQIRKAIARVAKLEHGKNG